eukprot:CAMPEP_0194552806 /NCGR_PEP_ID=MMETSP0253-20130528/96915_1 /TAXON_ID=2966 /ORGANISM="Noctiluca scintillans" /LENGTH=336 /DNA_ID=CAMNT_0039400279 /DNA_START=57 /DNA_END=1063 /DNA_ORIENTATION=+
MALVDLGRQPTSVPVHVETVQSNGHFGVGWRSGEGHLVAPASAVQYSSPRAADFSWSKAWFSDTDPTLALAKTQAGSTAHMVRGDVAVALPAHTARAGSISENFDMMLSGPLGSASLAHSPRVGTRAQVNTGRLDGPVGSASLAHSPRVGTRAQVNTGRLDGPVGSASLAHSPRVGTRSQVNTGRLDGPVFAERGTAHTNYSSNAAPQPAMRGPGSPPTTPMIRVDGAYEQLWSTARTDYGPQIDLRPAGGDVAVAPPAHTARSGSIAENFDMMLSGPFGSASLAPSPQVGPRSQVNTGRLDGPVFAERGTAHTNYSSNAAPQPAMRGPGSPPTTP